MSESQSSFGQAFDAGASGALMDRIYRRQRHIYDASRKFYLRGRDGLLAGLEEVLIRLEHFRYRFWNPGLVRVALKARGLRVR